ncbi:hypothetical protein [Hoeflea sp.]|uniref:hypothetical protein n=1 Tax=Hoeflea sp. TaxID=1940281 RepID=UPI003B51C542
MSRILRLSLPRFFSRSIALITALAFSNAALAQTSPAWLDGWWQTRSLDRNLGLVAGLVEVTQGGTQANLWLPDPAGGPVTGPFPASDIRTATANGQQRVVLTFPGQRQVQPFNMDALSLSPDTFVIPTRPDDEISFALSTGLNPLGNSLEYKIPGNTDDTGQLIVRLAVPQGTRSRDKPALDGVWQYWPGAPGFQRTGVRSRFALNSDAVMGPEVWVRQSPVLTGALSQNYDGMPEPGSKKTVTLRLAGVLLPPTGGVGAVQFSTDKITWTGEYRQLTLAEAEIDIEIDGALEQRAVRFTMDGTEGVWFPDPPALEPAMGAFVRDFRADVQVTADVAVAGEVLRLKVVYDEPPALNVQRFLVKNAAGGGAETVRTYRSADNPRVFLSAPLVILSDGMAEPAVEGLWSAQAFVGADRPAIAINLGQVEAPFAAIQEPVTAIAMRPVAGARLVRQPLNLVSQARQIARACINENGESDTVEFEDHAALIAFRDAILERIAATTRNAPGLSGREDLERKARLLLESAMGGGGSPLLNTPVSLQDGAQPVPAGSLLTEDALKERLGDQADFEDVFDFAKRVAGEADGQRLQDLNDAYRGVRALEDCEPEALLAGLAPMIPSHGNLVGASLLRFSEAGEGRWPLWRNDRVLTGRINGLPALAEDVAAQDDYLRQKIIATTAAITASFAVGMTVFRTALAASATTLFGIQTNALVVSELGLLGIDALAVNWDIDRHYRLTGLAQQLESTSALVPVAALDAARRRAQEAGFDAALGTTLLGLGAAFSPIMRRISTELYTGRIISPSLTDAYRAGRNLDVLNHLDTLARSEGHEVRQLLSQLRRSNSNSVDILETLQTTNRRIAQEAPADIVDSAAERLLPFLDEAIRYARTGIDASHLSDIVATGNRLLSRRELTRLGNTAMAARQIAAESRGLVAITALATLCRWGPVVSTTVNRFCAGFDEEMLNYDLETGQAVLQVGDDGQTQIVNRSRQNLDLLLDRLTGFPLLPLQQTLLTDEAVRDANQNLKLDTPGARETFYGPHTVETGQILISNGLEGLDLVGPWSLFHGSRQSSPAEVRISRQIMRDEMQLEEALGNVDGRAWLTEIFGQEFINEMGARAGVEP